MRALAASYQGKPMIVVDEIAIPEENLNACTGCAFHGEWVRSNEDCHYAEAVGCREQRTIVIWPQDFEQHVIAAATRKLIE
jgi:hypothetical protein